MDDALPPVRHAEVRQAKRLDVLLEGGALRPRLGLRDEVFDSREVLARNSAEDMSRLEFADVHGELGYETARAPMCSAEVCDRG